MRKEIRISPNSQNSPAEKTMLKASWTKYVLKFKSPALTSRERMLVKPTWYVKLFDPASEANFAIGECAMFPGLSVEDTVDFETILDNYCKMFSQDNSISLPSVSSIRFGFETALADWNNGCKHIPYISAWTEGEGGIVINGLVWMGSIEEMTERAMEKIHEGFRCIKLKIGAQDFHREICLLKNIREQFPISQLEIRLDANGAFNKENVYNRLDKLACYGIHSIEQPVARNNWQLMAEVCKNSPIPVALDEELIGTNDMVYKEKLLKAIKPAFIVLKPSLCGGFSGALEWIALAQEQNIGWWITSALESSVGLNAISSWVATLDTSLPQGLGTGQLYLNDIYSPVYREGENLFFNSNDVWSFPPFEWH